MRPQSGVSLTLVLGLLLLPCIACGDDDDGDNPVGVNTLAGFTTVPPSIDGAWTMSSSIVTSNCGGLNELFAAGPLRLDATQTGNDLAFVLQDSCGRRLPGGVGRVDTAQTVTLTSQDFSVLTATCVLRIRQIRMGTAAVPANAMSGNDVLHISEAVIGTCGPALPCTVNGTFTATRCPPNGCNLTCTP